MSGQDEDALFDELVRRIDGVPEMSVDQGRRVWDHIRRTRPRLLLDIGTCYGASAAYMAGACQANGVGRVVTVDSGLFDHRSGARTWSEELFERCDVTERIEMVRIPHSSYAWWLADRVRRRTGPSGACTPEFDFIYLDGAKLLTLDATAVVFSERLLREDGWLLMDDLGWSFDNHDEVAPVLWYSEDVQFPMSPQERSTPHLREVYDLVVKQHPSFTQFVDDGWWGWAQKAPDRERSLVVQGARRSRRAAALGVLRHPREAWRRRHG